ncbi:MAG: DUF3482 domain-containing protein [Burkholderiales bacterium]|nr:DUF3482 domain-containing protein [Burkholderiales bacterium]
MSEDLRRVDLSLISHTNIGKTTLARTLLARDIGEVRDAAHVTDLAEPHTMIESAEGDVLRLWDTPGFGDSARLAKRLAQSGNPIGWFLTEVWDRWRDRPFWSSQQALKPEMQILEWFGKPAIVLLNQAGEPRPRAEEQAEEERWASHVARYAFVRDVLTLDAFARAWVQEFVLLRAVAKALPEPKRAAFARLSAAWQGKRMSEFETSMAALAEQLARAACGREALDETGVKAALREVGAALGIGRNGEATAKDRAMQRLAERLDADIRGTTDRLIAANGLEGRAAAEVLARMAGDYAVRERMSEGKAAVVGGLVSGALSGLAADVAAGGLTFGAGMLTGGLLGALGAAGLARGYNLVRGAKETTVCWSDEFLDGLFSSALLRYLAVAHYGRGRGEWAAAEYPPFWREEVAKVVESRRGALAAIWSERGGECDTVRLAATLQRELAAAALDLLERLYPGALDAQTVAD